MCNIKAPGVAGACAVMSLEKKEWWRIGALVVVTTLCTYAYSFLAAAVEGNSFRSLLELWNRWDAPHYLSIAEHGYLSHGGERLFIVFYPFYPFLIGLFRPLVHDYAAAALVASNLSYAASVYFIYRLARLDYCARRSLGAVLFYSIFPTAYFLHAGYTESTFIALAAASFYYARRKNWVAASIVAMLASLTRVTGILLLPALLVELVEGEGFRLRRVGWEWVWLLLILLGPLCYLVINYVVYGDALMFLHFQSTNWHKAAAFPWEAVYGAWRGFRWREIADKVMVSGAELMFTAFALSVTVAVFLKVRKSYGVYMALVVLMSTSISFLLSMPRYTLSLFPAFIYLGAVLTGRQLAGYLVTFVFSLMYAFFCALFVGGKWAF